MKILITAFEPFGGENINSTQELICLLPSSINGFDIDTIFLPVVFDRCADVLEAKMECSDYSAVICLGQNSLADKINVERVAINVKDARIADNDGIKPADEPIVDGGDAAYFSTLPIKDMVKASLDVNVPAQVSNSAGTFVCNNIMYHLLHLTKMSNTKAGFIHIPQTPAQAEYNSYPSMDSATAAKGVAAMISAL